MSELVLKCPKQEILPMEDVEMYESPGPMRSSSAVGHCMICLDADASRHYGSVCCSGCKGFFRRSIRHNRAYTCPYNNKCVIRKEYRNSCRACRLQKCLDVGLNPMLVHGDRGFVRKDSNASSPSSSELPDTPGGDPRPSTSSSLQMEVVDVKPLEKDNLLDNTFYQSNRWLAVSKLDFPLGIAKLIPAFNPDDAESIGKYFVSVEWLCDQFVDSEVSHVSEEFIRQGRCDIELPVAAAIMQPRRVCSRTPLDWSPKFEYTSLDVMRSCYCRLLVHFFDWMSHIPELTELTESDRRLLVVDRIVPCVWLLMCYRTMCSNASGVLCTGGQFFPESNPSQASEWVLGSHRTANYAKDELIEPLKRLGVTRGEYSLMRVLCLTVPVGGLSHEGAQLITKARQKYLAAFTQIIRQGLPAEVNASQVLQRISKLMMLLPVTERIAQLDDNTISMMTLFDIGGMKGSLPFEIHVRKP
ncbi:Zinc finger and Nuclear hormone receptor domain containing protein [Aphelenchoides fujianensis]|nr:Zinc finger and Nuclear hormone receptor domain containing protein [Aphelenchoides fujianensis]